MKIKKIISLCKANKHISLYDMTTQMLGDGLAAYYLNDCPVFSIDSLMTSFDITPTQADKIVQRYTAEPPEAFLKMVKDEFDGEERCDPLPISLQHKKNTFSHGLRRRAGRGHQSAVDLWRYCADRAPAQAQLL
jgi:hypothetical protein